MISYEISISLSIIPIILLSGSLNLMDIVYIQNIRGLFIFPLLPIAFIFFISILAETNRAPFDMPEAEAEIVAGYNLEYSSIIFAFFFLGEYSNMIAMSALFVIFFFGGSHPAVYFLPLELGPLFFSVKVVFICFLFIKARAAVPRYRYDQLMGLN
jgi:NADH-quinone oxidoreductase subunit H